MKAVVLAGGYATRLWPITKDRPKMLLPVGETTVIDRIFDTLEDDDRIESVYVSTNERFADDFATHLEQSDYEKPQLSIEDTTEESEKFGVVGALAQLLDREGIDDDLLVIAGDNLIGFSISELVDYFQTRQTTTLAAYDVGDVKKAKSYGIVELDEERVVGFQEKPENPKSTLASIACYAFPAESLRFEEYLQSDNNPDEPGWYIQWLQSREPVYAFVFEEPWFDIGTPSSYLEAVSWALDGDSVIAESATIERSTIGANVQVMPGASIVDSTIERSLVFGDVTITDCEIRDSIIDRGTELENVDLAGALIGAHTQLTDER
ncbi:MAG: NDP-sugar synthase [Natronomonas sp.]